MARRFDLYGGPGVRGPGQVPDLVTRRVYWGDHGALLATGDAFTVTLVNVTPAVNSVNNRPWIQLAGAGAATDGYQAQSLGEGIRLGVADKVFRMCGLIRSADIALHEFLMGVNATDTTVIASDSTDFAHVRKLTGETVFSGRSRKASGSASTVPIGMSAVANDTDYFWEMELVRSSSAGKGKMRLYWMANPTPGSQADLVFDYTFPSQFPDTVDLAPVVAWRAGSTVTTLGFVGGVAWEQEA